MGTAAALELTEKGCEGQVRIHAIHCFVILFQTPIPFHYTPQVLVHQTRFKYFHVAIQQLDLHPSMTKWSVSSGGIPSFSNAAKR